MIQDMDKEVAKLLIQALLQSRYYGSSNDTGYLEQTETTIQEVRCNPDITGVRMIPGYK